MHLDRWRLRLDGGSPGHGHVAVVLPVRRADGTPAALKLQVADEETAGEPDALRVWGGDGAVRLLEHDPVTGAMLLERLHADRSLIEVRDETRALEILAGLLARLSAVPAPVGMRRLGDLAAVMLEEVPRALPVLSDARDRALLGTCAAVVGELAGQPGDRLLHWDLHYENVLAGDREPWLAIDPKPLSGHPGFELLPALRNRWGEVVASGDPARAVRRRFDLMVEVLGLDRHEAAGWTLARVLQVALWIAADGVGSFNAEQAVIARALIPRL